jgi:hypothetical protein
VGADGPLKWEVGAEEIFIIRDVDDIFRADANPLPPPNPDCGAPYLTEPLPDNPGDLG